jgi:hypothetical protein
VEDSQRREILKQIDEITKQIWEHEESRQKIDQLYEELYRRIKELGDDTGESLPQSKLRLDHVLMWFRARVQSSHRDQPLEAGRRKASRTQRQARPRR